MGIAYIQVGGSRYAIRCMGTKTIDQSDSAETSAPLDEREEQHIHKLLLEELRKPRQTPGHAACSPTLIDHLRQANLRNIEWQSAEEVAYAAECLYGIPDDVMPVEEMHGRVRDLVKHAALHFEKENKWDDAFRLFQRVQLHADLMDGDLFRLRNTLVLYEQRRVQHLRHVMLLVVALVIGFIVIIAPILFVRFENPHRSSAGEPPWRMVDGLYWSLSTALTIGYGDITPVTGYGRTLAMVNGIAGWTLMGITVGMILSYMTPRRLP
jgi:hypothetical protein